MATTAAQRKRLPRATPVRVWLVIGLIAGTLDIGDNIVLNHFRGVTPAMIFRFIASGLTGSAGAQRMGAWAIPLGVAMHYAIALTWTAIFCWLFRRIPFLRRQPARGGLLYGAFVWMWMNWVMVPLSRVPHLAPRPGILNRINSIAPVVLFIGLLVALWVARYTPAEYQET